ncbi:MAG: cysteine hydrolase family protein [Pseudomonadota bacterium]
MNASDTRLALVIIDVQKGMFDFPGIGPINKTGLLSNIQVLIERAREAAYPIIYIKHKGGPDHPFSKSADGHDIAAEIAPQPGDHIVLKSECGVFTNTELESLLQDLSIRHLVICGMQTEFCVDTAIRTAADRGYGVVVASGAHATFDSERLSARQIAEHHEAVWAQTFGSVQTYDEIKFGEVIDAPA